MSHLKNETPCGPYQFVEYFLDFLFVCFYICSLSTVDSNNISVDQNNNQYSTEKDMWTLTEPIIGDKCDIIYLNIIKNIYFIFTV